MINIRKLFANEPISKELHDATRRLQQERFADPQYVDRYLKGGAVEKREQRLIGIILGRPIAEATATLTSRASRAHSKHSSANFRHDECRCAQTQRLGSGSGRSPDRPRFGLSALQPLTFGPA
jgi:hypothetical protein